MSEDLVKAYSVHMIPWSSSKNGVLKTEMGCFPVPPNC